MSTDALLTERQQEILTFIAEYQDRNYGMSPTYREIGKHFGIKSPNGVKYHLKALEKKGCLVPSSTVRARCIRLAGVLSSEERLLMVEQELARSQERVQALEKQLEATAACCGAPDHRPVDGCLPEPGHEPKDLTGPRS